MIAEGDVHAYFLNGLFTRAYGDVSCDQRIGIGLGGYMRSMRLRIAQIIAAAMLAICSSALASDVCRNPSFEGMLARTERIHDLLGPNVEDLTKMKVYVSLSDGNLYLQSNFRSERSDGGGHYDNPSKIRIARGKMDGLESAIANLVFDQSPDDAGWERVRTALPNIEFLIDPSALDVTGRPPLDLSGAKRLRLASDEALLPSGELSLTTLNHPPPALIETLEGCCLRGRPPGQGAQLRSRLAQRRIDPEHATLFSMVVDSATRKEVESGALASLVLDGGAKSSEAQWRDALDHALAASRGKTMIVLSHVAAGRIVVEDAAGRPIFSTGLDDIHAAAREADVHLVLIGCETIRSAAASDIPVAIVGKYNTLDAARRLGLAMKGPGDGLSFMKALANENLVVVAQKGSWEDGGVGAGLYERRSGAAGRWVRALRVWFMGQRRG